MSDDRVTLSDLYENYDERPKRMTAIRLTPANLADVAQAFVYELGLKVSVDFKDLTLTFSTDKGDVIARYCDYVTVNSDGPQVFTGSEFRRNWRKFKDQGDW